MSEIFLDANIFFAATHSPKGGSGFIIELAKKNCLKIVTTNQILLEAERNIFKKLGAKYLNRHYQNLSLIKLKIQPLHNIAIKLIDDLTKFLPLKDVPVFLGAFLSQAKLLITLDKKHFLDNPKLHQLSLPFKVINPGEFINKYLKAF